MNIDNNISKIGELDSGNISNEKYNENYNNIILNTLFDEYLGGNNGADSLRVANYFNNLINNYKSDEKSIFIIEEDIKNYLSIYNEIDIYISQRKKEFFNEGVNRISIRDIYDTFKSETTKIFNLKKHLRACAPIIEKSKENNECNYIYLFSIFEDLLKILGITNIAKKIFDEGLKKNKKNFLFLGGWINKNNSGHQIVFYIDPNNHRIVIFNSGMGVEHHGKIHDNKGYVIIQNNNCTIEQMEKTIATIIFFIFFFKNNNDIESKYGNYMYYILKEYCNFDFSHDNKQNNFYDELDFQPLQLSGSCTYFSVHHYMRYIYYNNGEFAKFNNFFNFIKITSIDKILNYILSYVDNKLIIPGIMRKNIQLIESKLKDYDLKETINITNKINTIKTYIQNQYINSMLDKNILKNDFQFIPEYQFDSEKHIDGSGYLERLYNGRNSNVVEFIQLCTYDYVYMQGEFNKCSGFASDEIALNFFINSLMYSYQNSSNEIYESINQKEIIDVIFKIILVLVKFYTRKSITHQYNYDNNNVCYVPLYWTFFFGNM